MVTSSEMGAAPSEYQALSQPSYLLAYSSSQQSCELGGTITPDVQIRKQARQGSRTSLRSHDYPTHLKAWAEFLEDGFQSVVSPLRVPVPCALTTLRVFLMLAEV